LTSSKSGYSGRVKVPLHVVKARRERLAQLIEQHRYLPVQELCRRLGVSEATARRDLAALASEGKVQRTYGGVLTEFNDRFPSFRQRQRQGSSAKRRLAREAASLIQAGETYFFDSGTTIFAVAEAFRAEPVTPVTIVTSNLPVGEMLAAVEGVRVHLLAGQLLHLQSTLLGETAQRSLEFWEFDLALMSAEGMTARGVWNSQEDIIAQQRVVLRRSKRSVFCIDGSKLNRETPHFLASWREISGLVTELSDERLRAAGIEPHRPQPPPKDGSLHNEGEVPLMATPDDMPVHIL
jgi:DeoR/GlpR family transcriptional regulator of sugar metabolism